MADFQLNSFLADSQLCLQIVVAMERITNNSNSYGVFLIAFCISLSVYDLDVHFLCSFLWISGIFSCRADIANSSCSVSAGKVPSTLW